MQPGGRKHGKLIHCMYEIQMIDVALIGAQKSGTTTLAALLAQHPSVCLAREKEAHLFDQLSVQEVGIDTDTLSRHFPHRERGQVLVDATPSYLYLPGCIESLTRHNPNARILVILRDPAERAVSHHAHEQRLGFERRSLPLALMLERFRLWRDRNPLGSHSAHRHFSYIDRGRYTKQLQRLSSLTPNYLIIEFSDLFTHPQATMDSIFAFLGLSSINIENVPKLNARHDHPKFWQITLARMFLRDESQDFALNRIPQLDGAS